MSQALDLKSTSESKLHLFLISFTTLFFELACIRWFGASVVLLNYFTNLVLLAAFLGISVGCLTASSKTHHLNSIFKMMAYTFGFAFLIEQLHLKSAHLHVDFGGSSTSPYIYFGTEQRLYDPMQIAVPMWVLHGIFFVLIAAMFVGLGQTMGRAFDALTDRTQAYAINILGSLTGIAAFSLASWLQIPAFFWFVFCLSVFQFFRIKIPALKSSRGLTFFYLLVLALILSPISYGSIFRRLETPRSHTKTENVKTIWSPYYKITYMKDTKSIWANNMAHQDMVSVPQSGPAYALPYLLNQNASLPPMRKVLVIGAGSGNDLAAALAYGGPDIQVDAVEIDPAIMKIGRADHPSQPYQSPRVHRYLDDGRNFLKKHPEKKYDLIIYALVDSLVLHSGYSSLRLENFLFTQEAFQDAKRRLNPDGLFVVYNYFRHGWLIGRLTDMTTRVFGAEPMVLTMPYQAEIDPAKPADYFTMLIAGDRYQNARMSGMRAAFQANQFFWVHESPIKNLSLNAFSFAAPDPQDPKWLKIAPASFHAPTQSLFPTDDWPFLYLRQRMIPFKPTWEGIVVVSLISILILGWAQKGNRFKLNGAMFFLGAGFMLIETKSVVHMALLFGSTWMVNSVVFAAILLMSLFANLFVIEQKPAQLQFFYFGLILTLLAGAFLPLNSFLALPWEIRVLLSSILVFSPVFFAGVIFSSLFRQSTNPGGDMGSNVAGIILGGLSENLSLMLGFNHLLFVAILFYLLSAVFRRNQTS